MGPFSIDMYMPAFPAIAKGLHTDVKYVELSLTSFFIGISFGQLIYGPLLDRFGRKKPLYIGLIVYVLATLGCAFSRSVNMLIFMRLLQALGSCAGMVAARALVRDLFPVGDIAKVFSLLLLVIAVSPMAAPTIGAYVADAFGWNTVFFILALIAILIIIGMIFWLPEGRKPDDALSLKPKHITSNFYTVLKHPYFFTFAVTGGIASASQYAYLSGSADTFIDFYHASKKQYGRIFAFIAAGLIISSQINSLALRKYSNEQIIKVALRCQTVIGLCMCAVSYSGLMNEAGMITSIFLFLCCQGFISSNTSALSLTPFAKQAGSASALMGTIQMGLGACSSALVSVFNNGTPVPMTAIMAVCAICALTLMLQSHKLVSKYQIAEPA